MIAWVLRRLRGETGFSLIEMITVMAIMSVVFAGITTAFVSASKAQNEQDRRFRAQLNTRLALDKIRKDLHCASDVTPFATNSVTIKLPSGCGGDISWCTVAVSGFTNRYALYRQSGSSSRPEPRNGNSAGGSPVTVASIGE